MIPRLRALIRAAPEAVSSRERTALDLHLPDGASVPLLRVRDQRVRRLRLTVSERGVRLSVPWRLSEQVASAFVQDHAGWIAAQWQRFRDVHEPVAWRFGALAALPLGGVDAPLEWLPARSARIETITPDAATSHATMLRFHAPLSASAAALRRAVLEFYAAEARAAVHRWLPAYLSGLPRPPAGSAFARWPRCGAASPRTTGSRWISPWCSARPVHSNTCWCTSSAISSTPTTRRRSGEKSKRVARTGGARAPTCAVMPASA